MNTINCAGQPLSPGRAAYLRRRWCRRQANSLWGRKRIVQPVLVPYWFGDGRQIISLRPITTRTHHYVVAIDSRWLAGKSTLHDYLDPIYERIIEHFGEVNKDDDGETIGCPFRQWPAIDLTIGCELAHLNSVTPVQGSMFDVRCSMFPVPTH